MAKISPLQVLPDTRTSVEEWQTWHTLLKKRYGKKTANQLWIIAWKRYGSAGKDTHNLREYLSKNGIELEKGIWDSIIDIEADITDFFGDIFQVGKWVGIGLAVIIVGGIGIAIYNIAKKPIETLGAVAKLRTGMPAK